MENKNNKNDNLSDDPISGIRSMHAKVKPVRGGDSRFATDYNTLRYQVTFEDSKIPDLTIDSRFPNWQQIKDNFFAALAFAKDYAARYHLKR